MLEAILPVVGGYGRVGKISRGTSPCFRQAQVIVLPKEAGYPQTLAELEAIFFVAGTCWGYWGGGVTVAGEVRRLKWSHASGKR